MSRQEPRRSSPSQVETILAARRYYLEGASKSEIAAELGLSRFQIARLLETARRKGIVKIEIQEPPAMDVELAGLLGRRFGLRDAIVVQPAEHSEQSRRSQLGQACADLLTRIVKPSDVVGVSWGRTIHSMADHLTTLPACSVVQIVGSVPTLELDVNSMELVRRVAECARGPVYPLHVPLLVDTPEMAAALRADPHVARTAAMFEKLSLAIVGIGAWTDAESTVRPAMAPEMASRLDAAGATADVCAIVFDAQGREIADGGLADRSIAISSRQLRAVPEVIAVAGGARKAAAILAVLRSGLIHRLITDVEAAERLLSA